MAAKTDHDLAEMLARCETLIARSQELGTEHNAVIAELERLLAAIEAALGQAPNVQ